MFNIGTKNRRNGEVGGGTPVPYTTKWNVSDPVYAPMACNIVANYILKTL